MSDFLGYIKDILFKGNGHKISISIQQFSNSVYVWCNWSMEQPRYWQTCVNILKSTLWLWENPQTMHFLECFLYRTCLTKARPHQQPGGRWLLLSTALADTQVTVPKSTTKLQLQSVLLIQWGHARNSRKEVSRLLLNHAVRSTVQTEERQPSLLPSWKAGNACNGAGASKRHYQCLSKQGLI